MAQTERPLDIVVIGAGLCGLASAIALSQAGHRVEVLESFSNLHEVGAGLQCTPNTARLMKSWGLWEKLEPHAAKMSLLQIQRFDGRLLARRDNYQHEVEEHYGTALCGFHRVDLQLCLAERALEVGASIRFGARVSDVDFQAPSVTVEGEDEKVYADVVLAADGLWSSTRSKFLGCTCQPLPTGRMAYRITVPLDNVPQPDLRQWMTEARNNIWIGPDAHAVAYSVRQGTLLNIVLLVKNDLPANVAKAPGDVEAMRLLFEGWDPVLTRFLDKASKVFKWRLHHLMPLESWTNEEGTFAMAGDSCHPILPYMSQGANSAFEDAATLGVLLSRIRVQEVTRQDESGPANLPVPAEVPEWRRQVKRALKTFQTLRLERTKRIHGVTFEQGESFHLHDGPAQEERDRALAKSFEPDSGSGERWTHPRWQPWIWGFDAQAVAESHVAAVMA